MGITAKNAASAQGADAANPKLVDHVVSQADLDLNPDLVAAGVLLGDTIQIPEVSDVVETPDTKEADLVAPQWAADLMASNQAVIESNNAVLASSVVVNTSNEAVLDGISDFKVEATNLIKTFMQGTKIEVTGENTVAVAPVKLYEIDEDATYVVSKGKSFQDKETDALFTAGMDVTDFEDSRLQFLLSQNIIEIQD